MSSSCLLCAKMLKQVLAQENSRPMAILEAMGGKQGEEQTTGSTIQVPTKRSGTVSQQWSQLASNSRNRNSEKAEAGETTVPTEEKGNVIAAGTTAMVATSANTTSIDEHSIIQEDPQLDDFESLQIECRPCANTGPESGARAFVMGPTPLSIVLCSNRLSFQSTHEVEQVLVHELMHVYDVRVNLLELRGCENLAYSEVRAAREAECKDAPKWLFGGTYCIQQKAYQATSNLFPEAEAKACLAKVFDAAMADTVPLAGGTSKNGGKPRPCATSSRTYAPKRRMTTLHVPDMEPSER